MKDSVEVKEFEFEFKQEFELIEDFKNCELTNKFEFKIKIKIIEIEIEIIFDSQGLNHQTNSSPS